MTHHLVLFVPEEKMTDKLVPTPIPVVAVLNLTVQNLGNDETAPHVGSYSIDARVKGLFARVSTEFTIVNDNARIMEGELEFPLPDGAVVCGYAIDIDGVMVEASVVEKEKARIAFENEVKKGVDPGLVEQVRGNAYRTRIYPLPARGSRRIRVEYMTPLVLGAQGDAALFLPMPHEKLEKRDIVISVDIPEIPAPKLGGLGDRRFAQAEAVWKVEAHEENVSPDDDLIVAVPEIPATLTSVEICDDAFFAVSVRVEPPKAEQNHPVPDKWRIIWDASGSRDTKDIELARAFLNVLPEKADYALHVFRNALEDVRRLASRAELLKALENIAYDGGTDFAPLTELAKTEFGGMTLVFSDGLDTWTGTLPEFGSNSVAMVSGRTRDAASLRRMCGGRLLDLGLLSPQEALDLVVNPSPVVSEFSGDGIANVQGIGISAVGRVTVIGRLMADQSDAELVLSDGRRFPVTLSRSGAKQGKTLAAAWAARRIDELSPSADNHREELLAVGRRFSIVSPVSSMIVFERLDQWLEYDIEPPESLAEIHEEWLKKRRNQSADKENKDKQWISRLSSEWDGRVSWWNSPVPQIQKPRSGIFDGEGGGGFVQRAFSAVADRFRGASSARGGAARGAAARRFEFNGMDDEDTVAQAPRMMERTSPAMMGGAPAMMGMPAPAASMPGGAVNAMFQARMADDCDECCVCEDCCADAGMANDIPKPASVAASMTIQAWDPNTPYLKAIKDAAKVFGGSDDCYREYLRQRSKYAASPAFFLDCAGLFFKENQKELAIRILSNLSELKIDDPALLRVYAWRLREADELELALTVLRKVAKLRPDEAVSWRDLALTLTIRAKKTGSAQDAKEALELFHKAAFTSWERRDAIYTSVVALEELNALIAWCERQKWPDDKSPKIPEFDPKFRKLLDLDLRIVLMWDADDTDIDLHVLEPSGEEVFYQNKRSQTGAMLSYDVTTGYGPEEYLHKKAPAGEYKIMSNYFASHQQKLTGNVTVTATVFTNWGRENEASQTMSLRLEKAKEHVRIGSIKVD